MNQSQRNELYESGVETRQYFYLFRSWAWLILLTGLLAGLAAYLVSRMTTPVYEASSRLLVSAPSTITGVEPASLVTTQTMASTYAQMLLDPPVLQGVIDQLKLNTTPEALRKSISVEVALNTQLLTITAEDTSPNRAAEIANTMASVFTSQIRELQSQRFAASRDGLAKQVADMEQQIAATTDQIAREKDAVTLEQLQARLTQYRTIYANLVTSYEQVRLAEEQTSTNVVVSAPAAVNTIPVRPNTLLNVAVTIMLAMLLAAGVAFSVELFDDTIRSPDEVRKKLGLPLLGIILRHGAENGHPIALTEPFSPATDAFRSLQVNIAHAALDQPLRRILITSPTAREGKTAVACSLAVVLSQTEQRVVLLDADLRRPQVHNRLGLHNRTGLGDLLMRPLADAASVSQIIDPPGLTVITSGESPANPTELLMSHRMGNILAALNRDFDVTVIDTPPLLTETDAVVLSSATDGVIMVAKPGTTKLGAFKQGLEQLQAAGARVLGVVLNDIDLSDRRYGYFYRWYYSKYSPESESRWLRLREFRVFGRRRRHGEAPSAEPALPTPEVVASEPQAVATEPEADEPEGQEIAELAGR